MILKLIGAILWLALLVGPARLDARPTMVERIPEPNPPVIELEIPEAPEPRAPAPEARAVEAAADPPARYIRLWSILYLEEVTIEGVQPLRRDLTRYSRSSHSRISVVPGISSVCVPRPTWVLILECLAPASTSIRRIGLGKAP